MEQLKEFEFGFKLSPGFTPEPEPEWHHSSAATNMVLAAEYRARVKAAHDKYTGRAMTLKEARAVTGHGRLGKPSKMPGWSTALPAAACKTGAKLAKIPGSVCSSCYALKGNYLFPNVKASHELRLSALEHPRWVDGMVTLVGHYTDPMDPYFRIHDSGDFQSVPHILNWIEVARRLPWVKFWAPTKEPGMVKRAIRMIGGARNWPDNLTVRVSVFMVGDAPPKAWVDSFGLTSTVSWDDSPDQCPAYGQGGRCLDCRACWDPNVKNVNYPIH